MLALFLHPMYFQTFKQFKDDTELTSLSELARIVIFYFQRFINSDIGQLRMENYVKVAFKGSRLAQLAIIILSVVINTATCKRLFSEMSQIHTARRNRLKPEKVKKISIVRQAVRTKNAIEDSKKMDESSAGRIVEAEERARIAALDEMQFQLDMQGEDDGKDDEMDDEIDDEMDEEEEPIGQVFFEWTTILGMGAKEDASKIDEVVEQNVNEIGEVIEENQLRRPWPPKNIDTWPQEPIGAKLTGLRGKKVALEILFHDVCLPQGFK
ncbi:MAG: hypothetical protein M1826_007561 [Phylliscum demangeonii]|nr:MAG: hypothetical protein M1826_007561 [Phylliscum demangeonii]